MTATSTTPGRLVVRPDHAIGRWLASIFPDGEAIEGEAPLELIAEAADPPKLAQATVIEGRDLRAIPVEGEPEVAIAAFLDGRQESAVRMYRPGGVPIVAGTIGAVIRERRDRRMFTWSHRVDQRIYVPARYLSASDRRALDASGAHLRDTTSGAASDAIEHPLALRELARNLVRNDRESLEHTLAQEWCAAESRPLLLDGGISAAQPIARSACAIGVVKSHRTLYVQADALRVTLGLEAAQRTSVFSINPEKRAPVASWYLRLRDRAGRDPMWGLVRVEVSAPAGRDDIGARANEVSRWILAEAAPLALPDGRWDRMVYGVRDCEEFLRAVM
jgi:hypothetical protein